MSALNTELGVRQEQPRWPPSLEGVRQAGQLRDCRELFLHSVEEGDPDRLVGFALSEASTTTLLARGFSEDDLGLGLLRDAAERWLAEPAPWWLSYRVIVALQ